MNFFKKLFLITLVFVIIVILVITGLGFFMYKSAIDKTPISEKISKIKSDKNYVAIKDVPDNFKNAIIAIEDHRFRTHRGIDFITTTRSMLENIREKDIVAGGSTISQQLGRLLYFTQEKLFTRKIAELFVAFDLEKNYSKDEILELYINIIYYGDGYYGIKEASNGYFNKDPKDLNLSEATLLAGLPNAPSAYSPNKNPNLAKKRQATVLNAMVKYNYITEDKSNEIKNQNN
ncbi:MAG: transglycosylase domain-containing protein [Clostridia bacterium]|jgi:membrane peptidoglycan carboxypeptidase|nr:transglycosylase domain-containing protein [Clostridia bacterium]